MKVKPKICIRKRFLVLVCILGYVVVSFGQQLYRIGKLDEEIQGYMDVKAAIIQERQELEQEKKLLANKSYIERVAREDLGLIKPGEILLVPGKPGEVPKAKPVNAVSDNIH